MRGSSLGYLIKQGSSSVFKNRLMSFASIGVLSCCLILIGSALLLSLNIAEVVGYAESQNEVVVFLEDELDSSQISNLESNIANNPNVTETRFVSRFDALEETKQELGEAGELLDNLDSKNNPLPDSYVIRVKDVELLPVTVAELEKLDGVLQINAPIDAAKVLVQIRQVTIIVSTAIILILGVVSIMIIANTIKISVYSRSREINIMKYVGATDMFIKFPFIVEGIIIGLIASVISFLVLWGGYYFLGYWIANNPSSIFGFAQTTLVPFKDIALFIGSSFLVAGTVMGGFGSMIFARKHLKV